jgi:hypothetical protein
MLMAHTYNPSNSGGRDQENHISKPAQIIVCKSQFRKIPSQKQAVRVAQGVGPEFKNKRSHKSVDVAQVVNWEL